MEDKGILEVNKNSEYGKEIKDRKILIVGFGNMAHAVCKGINTINEISKECKINEVSKEGKIKEYSGYKYSVFIITKNKEDFPCNANKEPDFRIFPNVDIDYKIGDFCNIKDMTDILDKEIVKNNNEPFYDAIICIGGSEKSTLFSTMFLLQKDKKENEKNYVEHRIYVRTSSGKETKRIARLEDGVEESKKKLGILAPEYHVAINEAVQAVTPNIESYVRVYFKKDKDGKNKKSNDQEEKNKNGVACIKMSLEFDEEKDKKIRENLEKSFNKYSKKKGKKEKSFNQNSDSFNDSKTKKQKNKYNRKPLFRHRDDDLKEDNKWNLRIVAISKKSDEINDANKNANKGNQVKNQEQKFTQASAQIEDKISSSTEETKKTTQKTEENWVIEFYDDKKIETTGNIEKLRLSSEDINDIINSKNIYVYGSKRDINRFANEIAKTREKLERRKKTKDKEHEIKQLKERKKTEDKEEKRNTSKEIKEINKNISENKGRFEKKQTIIVIGAKRFAYSFIKSLYKENKYKELIVIDKDADLVTKVSKLGVNCARIADATDYDALEAVGLNSTIDYNSNYKKKKIANKNKFNNYRAYICIGNNSDVAFMTLFNLGELGIPNITLKIDSRNETDLAAMEKFNQKFEKPARILTVMDTFSRSYLPYMLLGDDKMRFFVPLELNNNNGKNGAEQKVLLDKNTKGIAIFKKQDQNMENIMRSPLPEGYSNYGSTVNDFCENKDITIIYKHYNSNNTPDQYLVSGTLGSFVELVEVLGKLKPEDAVGEALNSDNKSSRKNKKVEDQKNNDNTANIQETNNNIVKEVIEGIADETTTENANDFPDGNNNEIVENPCDLDKPVAPEPEKKTKNQKNKKTKEEAEKETEKKTKEEKKIKTGKTKKEKYSDIIDDDKNDEKESPVEEKTESNEE